MRNINTDLEIMKELHPTKNRNITINNIKRKMKVWWLCSKCNYEWKTTVSKRTSGKQGCPRCVGKVVSEYNCLENCYKELIKQWHPTKNGTLTPKDVTKSSTKRVWWYCDICKYEWESTVHNRSKHRTYKCPSCSGHTLTKYNCLETNYPELSKEWHPTKNGTLTPKDVTKSSRKRVWWYCSKCDTEWITYICNRTSNSNKNKCPGCTNHIPTKYNCLETNYPELSKEWHPTKNGTLTPKDFCAKSNKKMWWLCPKCNHEWKTQIIVRTRIKGSDCPKCVRKHHISKSSSKWLDELKISSEYREFLIRINKKRFIVDGYDPLTKTIYEYFGNYWHGNPNIFNPDDIHPVRKIKFGIIYQETIDRIKLFEENGYKIIYKWGD